MEHCSRICPFALSTGGILRSELEVSTGQQRKGFVVVVVPGVEGIQALRSWMEEERRRRGISSDIMEIRNGKE